MRAVWCGMAFGVVWLQQQAVLPGWFGLCVLGLCACAAGAFAFVWLSRASGEAGDRRDPLDPRTRWRRVAGWTAIWLAAGCVGFGYAAMRAHARLAFALPVQFEGRDIDLRGTIKGLPTRDDNGARLLFAVESTSPSIDQFPPLVQLTWSADHASKSGPAPAIPALEPGDRWQLRVRLKRAHGNANFGVRDAEAALFARNIRATGYVSAPSAAMPLRGRAHGIGVLFDRWRSAVRARIEAVLGDAPHRGIVVALAVGAQDQVSDDDWQLMRRTGTSHLVAISGLHIGFVAGLAAWLAGALWRRSCFIGRLGGGLVGGDWPLRLPAQYVSVAAGAVFAAMHASLAGFNVPAQRALWMLGVLALAFMTGRHVAASVVLAWALGLVLVIDPWAVLSAGFWLSFCAVAAIAFAMSGRVRLGRDSFDWRRPPATAGEDSYVVRPTRIEHGIACARHIARSLAERIASGAHVQFAVTIALAPLTVLWFAQIPLIGPLANAFAIPWVSLSVTPAVLAGVMLPAPFDALAFRVAHALLDVLVWALQHLAGPAWAVWPLPVPNGWTLTAAALGVAWCLAPRGWPLRWAAPLAWLPLVLPPPDAPIEGSFRLTALDIGQGSSVLVETAHHRLLFDAGPGPESTHAGERIVVPTLRAAGVTSLDALVISHSDSDHAGGAPAVFDGIEVHQLVASLAPDHPLWARAASAHADALRCAAGQRWQWDGVGFAMLWPGAGPLQGKPNAHCCVLRVTASDGHAALFAADIEAPEERALRARDPAALRADVLIVPHHGSKTSSTEPFLDSIEPLISVFQVGYRNRFHHPNAGVWARYQARRIELTRSDTDGAARIAEEGGRWSLERYRDTHRRYWMEP